MKSTFKSENRERNHSSTKNKDLNHIFFPKVRSKYGKDHLKIKCVKIKRKQRKELFNRGEIREDRVSMPSYDSHVSGVRSGRSIILQPGNCIERRLKIQ